MRKSSRILPTDGYVGLKPTKNCPIWSGTGSRGTRCILEKKTIGTTTYRGPPTVFRWPHPVYEPLLFYLEIGRKHFVALAPPPRLVSARVSDGTPRHQAHMINNIILSHSYRHRTLGVQQYLC